MFEKHPFRVSRKQARILRRHLAAEGGRPPHALEVDINEIATRYLVWKKQREAEAGRAVTRRVLRGISAGAIRLAGQLASLSDEGEWSLALQLERVGNPASAEWVLNAALRMHDLAIAANAAAVILKQGSDRRPRSELAWAVLALVHLWERAIGRKFTHTKGEMAEPISPSGLFVVAALQMFDTKATPSMVTTELGRIQKRQRRSKAAGGKSKKQGDLAGPKTTDSIS